MGLARATRPTVCRQTVDASGVPRMAMICRKLLRTMAGNRLILGPLGRWAVGDYAEPVFLLWWFQTSAAVAVPNAALDAVAARVSARAGLWAIATIHLDWME